MSDPADTVLAQTEEFADGHVTLKYEPMPGGQIRLAATADGDTLESGFYNLKIFGSATLRGQFLNSVEASLEDRDGVDADQVRRELKEWFADMNELDREEQAEKFLTDDVLAIIDGTHSVEVHGGETTKWMVTLTYAGRTCDLKFTAAEMVSGGEAALQEKIANQFYELIDLEKEDWEEIRTRWQDQKEVVNVVEETASDAVADRVLEYMSNNMIPVSDKEDLGNDVAAVWYDPDNSTACQATNPDQPIAWVQDSFFVDQLESVGKNTDYKPTLVQDLISRGDLFRGNMRKKWAWDKRTKVYPFHPDALGVSSDDVGDTGEPAHSEVGA